MIRWRGSDDDDGNNDDADNDVYDSLHSLSAYVHCTRDQAKKLTCVISLDSYNNLMRY